MPLVLEALVGFLPELVVGLFAFEGHLSAPRADQHVGLSGIEPPPGVEDQHRPGLEALGTVNGGDPEGLALAGGKRAFLSVGTEAFQRSGGLRRVVDPGDPGEGVEHAVRDLGVERFQVAKVLDDPGEGVAGGVAGEGLFGPLKLRLGLGVAPGQEACGIALVQNLPGLAQAQTHEWPGEEGSERRAIGVGTGGGVSQQVRELLDLAQFEEVGSALHRVRDPEGVQLVDEGQGVVPPLDQDHDLAGRGSPGDPVVKDGGSEAGLDPPGGGHVKAFGAFDLKDPDLGVARAPAGDGVGVLKAPHAVFVHCPNVPV